MLKDLRRIVLAGAKPPVGFFAYPGKPSLLAPSGCAFTRLASVEEDIEAALEALAAELGALALAPAHVAKLDPPAVPDGKITLDGIAAVLGALIPENAIVVDEAVSSGRGFSGLTPTRSHDWIADGRADRLRLAGSGGAAIACTSARRSRWKATAAR